jgi:hypothetical protein
MRKRRIRLADGRYLIFYTFEGERSGAQEQAEITARDDNEEDSKGEARKRGRSGDRLNPG